MIARGGASRLGGLGTLLGKTSASRFAANPPSNPRLLLQRPPRPRACFAIRSRSESAPGLTLRVRSPRCAVQPHQQAANDRTRAPAGPGADAGMTGDHLLLGVWQGNAGFSCLGPFSCELSRGTPPRPCRKDTSGRTTTAWSPSFPRQTTASVVVRPFLCASALPSHGSLSDPRSRETAPACRRAARRASPPGNLAAIVEVDEGMRRSFLQFEQFNKSVQSDVKTRLRKVPDYFL